MSAGIGKSAARATVFIGPTRTKTSAPRACCAGLAQLNRELIGKVEAIHWHYRAVLDLDSTDIPVYGEQERSAYNGHFESTCYHPLLLFNREGDCLATCGGDCCCPRESRSGR